MHPRLRKIVATAALAVFGSAAGVGLAVPAQATTLPGCYGAVIVFCDITVTVTSPVTVSTTSTTIPVCVDICFDVPVTLVNAGLSQNAGLCVTANDQNGQQNLSQCFQGPTSVVVGRCGSDVGYHIELLGTVLMGCEAPVGDPLPAIWVCASGTNLALGYYDSLTHLRLGTACGQ